MLRCKGASTGLRHFTRHTCALATRSLSGVKRLSHTLLQNHTTCLHSTARPISSALQISRSPRRYIHLSSGLCGEIVDVEGPAFAESISEGNICWIKQKGDFVNVDELVAKIETDEASVVVPSPFSGTIIELLVEDGSKVGPKHKLYKLAKPAADSPPKKKATEGNSNGDKRTRGTGANKPKYYVSLEACLRIFEEGMISKWKAWVLGAFILAMGSAIGLVQYSFSNESKSLRSNLDSRLAEKFAEQDLAIAKAFSSHTVSINEQIRDRTKESKDEDARIHLRIDRIVNFLLGGPATVGGPISINRMSAREAFNDDDVAPSGTRSTTGRSISGVVKHKGK